MIVHVSRGWQRQLTGGGYRRAPLDEAAATISASHGPAIGSVITIELTRGDGSRFRVRLDPTDARALAESLHRRADWCTERAAQVLPADEPKDGA